MYPLHYRKAYIESRKQEVNIIRGTVSRVVGLEFDRPKVIDQRVTFLCEDGACPFPDMGAFS